MGKIGLPAPVRELAARAWDVIVVGELCRGTRGRTAPALVDGTLFPERAR